MNTDTHDDEWRKMLQDCLDIEDGLTDWEVEFLESLGNQADDPSWIPSAKQFNKMRDIWEEKA